jgi:hypothetical protein
MPEVGSTWVGWAAATRSPCTSTTSPTSRPARDTRGGRSTERRTARSTPDDPWAAVKGHPEALAGRRQARHQEVHRRAGAVDVFTTAAAFTILESIRLDLGYRMDVHP